MSVSPSCSPPRRPLHERSSSQNNRLGIRLVPYSPPRIASDGSVPARVVSYADASTETDPDACVQCSSPTSRDSPFYETPSPSLGKAWAPVSSLRRSDLSPVGTPASAFDGWDADLSLVSRDENSYLERSVSPPTSPRPPSRRKVINVHSDKTFSVLPHDTSFSSQATSLRSGRPSDTTRSSSFGRFSNAFTDERPSSPLTPLTERSFSTPSPALFSGRRSSSPWSYRMVGGLRKVPKTPDLKQKKPQPVSETPPELPLPPLPEISFETATSSQLLSEKPSFQTVSSQTDSTLSARTNYKLYGQSSPVNALELESLPPSSSQSNYRVLAPPSSSDPSVRGDIRPQTEDSEGNFVLHEGQSSSSSSVVAVRQAVRPQFSRESLVVPPLRPTKRSSSENFYLHRSRSRDSIRTGSLTSISTILTQEATRAIFAGPATLLNQGGLGWHESLASLSSPLQNPVHARPHMPAPRTPIWSTQLSTVMSESERDSETASRVLTPMSAGDRRSSGLYSSHSRQLLGISASLAGLDEYNISPSHSRHGSLEPPPQALRRDSFRDPMTGGIRLIRDQDEDGDGLADLEFLRHRPSKTRMHYLATRSSDRNLRSSGSSRANSFNAGSLPTWARLYYGSGERRWLAAQASSDSMFSQYSERGSFFSRSRSPSTEPHPLGIFSPRRRPRDPASQQVQRQASNAGSMEITPVQPHPVLAVVRGIKKQTSSIWSPHLYRDRRAGSYHMWDVPTADWSMNSEMTGKRNAQVVLFIVGFVFPFAWMLAAFIPLHPPPSLEDGHHDQDATKPSSRNKTAANLDELVFRSAHWWRKLNRFMAVIGLLILGAVIALIVVGLRQRWGS